MVETIDTGLATADPNRFASFNSKSSAQPKVNYHKHCADNSKTGAVKNHVVKDLKDVTKTTAKGEKRLQPFQKNYLKSGVSKLMKRVDNDVTKPKRYDNFLKSGNDSEKNKLSSHYDIESNAEDSKIRHQQKVFDIKIFMIWERSQAASLWSLIRLLEFDSFYTIYKIYHFSCLERYTWRGTDKKRPSKSLKLLNYLLYTCVRNQFKDYKQFEYKNYMVEWLKHAKSRQRKVAYTYPDRKNDSDDSEDEISEDGFDN